MTARLGMVDPKKFPKLPDLLSKPDRKAGRKMSPDEIENFMERMVRRGQRVARKG